MKTNVLLILVLLPTLCPAQTYKEKTLYYFGHSSTDGSVPIGGLVMDAAGNLYGTTYAGGGSTACSGGCGTVFKLSTSDEESILHAFAGGSDGATPVASLAIDKSGNLYGTTPGADLGGVGNGTVFTISAGGKYSILHTFGTGEGDGLGPYGPLTLDSDGNMYGTTSAGGSDGYGMVFELSPSGEETILYDFTGGSDGAYPEANVLRDGLGNIYGTASSGGANASGVLFKLTPENVETVIYSFCSLANCSDGGGPNYIARSAGGNFFGNAAEFGIVFEVAPDGVETALYSFCLPQGIDCADGGGAIGPIMLSGGNIYGTASQDGATEGIVYELTTGGVETTLYGGSYPQGTYLEGGVIMDKSGNLYGTAAYGGHNDNGTIFKLTKN